MLGLLILVVVLAGVAVGTVWKFDPAENINAFRTYGLLTFAIAMAGIAIWFYKSNHVTPAYFGVVVAICLVVAWVTLLVLFTRSWLYARKHHNKLN
jgi:hypothetical protein